MTDSARGKDVDAPDVDAARWSDTVGLPRLDDIELTIPDIPRHPLAPPPSVDAAWEALREDAFLHDYPWTTIAHHRPRIEAAIRAESLDVPSMAHTIAARFLPMFSGKDAERVRGIAAWAAEDIARLTEAERPGIRTTLQSRSFTSNSPDHTEADR